MTQSRSRSLLHPEQDRENSSGRRWLRPFPLEIPTRVEQGGDAVGWSPQDWRVVRSRPTLLSEFVDLADGTGEQIVAFARRWGVLGLCKHHQVAFHAHTAAKQCNPEFALGLFWEDFADWRRYAGFFRELLYYAARLESGAVSTRTDWTTVIDVLRVNTGFFSRLSGHEKLAIALNILISRSRLRPVMVWSEQRWSLEFSGETEIGCGLFGALVNQLMLAVSGTEDLEFCSSCGRGYFPRRRSNRRHRNYCDACRRAGDPQRDAARDYRTRRNRAERESQSKSK